MFVVCFSFGLFYARPRGLTSVVVLRNGLRRYLRLSHGQSPRAQRHNLFLFLYKAAGRRPRNLYWNVGRSATKGRRWLTARLEVSDSPAMSRARSLSVQ